MNQAWKRARGSIFTMVALILLLLVPMSQAGAKDTDTKRNLIGKNVVPQHGETEVLGKVIDVAGNGDLIIRLSEARARGADRTVRVPASQVHQDQGRVVFEGNENQLVRMAKKDDDRGAKRGLIGKKVVPQHGETEVLGSVIDVADNGDVVIRLSGTRAKDDRIVTVPAGQIRRYQDRVVFEGNEDQLYRMAERDNRDYRGYYNRDRDGRD
ncbi:MAG: hypothetical protein CVU57_04150 [Deltaproteobacteria bacterium HGW-Deltaproteobacteria-15]|jgi:hypothetical protein|nr:MAG: hypothetical protein CVU57_04150 [Deltaproteobacteria bacterium HGW-Deltaproteobacteria-15]